MGEGTCTRPRCGRRPHSGGLCKQHYLAASRGLVAAGRIADELRRLHAEGWSDQDIATAAGMHRSIIQQLRQGHRPRVRAVTAARLTAVIADPAGELRHQPRTLVDALGTRRRLRALRAAGWRAADLAAATGVHAVVIYRVTAGQQRRVTAGTHEEIRRFFLDHQADPVRRPTPAVAEHMWPLPMEWDPDLIDDPRARPETHGHTLKHRRREYRAGRWPACAAAPGSIETQTRGDRDG